MKYMLWQRNTGVNEGINFLRAPGCFPHGINVAVMGYFRTGSTLLFNVARLWAALASERGMQSGFNCMERKSISPTKDLAKSKCTIVCKDHQFKGGVAETTDLVLMSHRDPFESVCSRKIMDQFCKDAPKDKKSMGVEEYHKQCKQSDALMKKEAVVQCHMLMEMQRDIYTARGSSGKEIALDVLLTDYYAKPEATVVSIGRAMGICEAALQNSPLVGVLLAMMKYLHDKPDRDMGITRMHDTHSAKKVEANCAGLLEWMRADPKCVEWMDGNASAASNSILRDWEAKQKAQAAKRQAEQKAQAAKRQEAEQKPQAAKSKKK